MNKLSRPGVYLIATVSTLGAAMLALWLSVSVDLEPVPIQMAAVNKQIFSPLKPSVKRDPFAYRVAKTVTPTNKPDSLLSEAPDRNEPASPVANMTYTGSLVRGGVLTAFILEQDEMYIVQSGDFVAKQFRVTKIQSDYVSLQKEPDGEAYMLYMSGSAQ